MRGYALQMGSFRAGLFQITVNLIAIIFGPFCFAEDQPSFSVAGFRCEYQQNPLGIDSTRPRLTWQIRSTERAVLPSAYQIQVTNEPEDSQSTGNVIWDSGMIHAADPTHADYSGPPLRSGQRCYWRVRVSDAQGNESPWSDWNWWEVALLKQSDWQASWIDDGRPVPQNDEDFYKDDAAPLFRKLLEVRKPVRRARLYISGLGFYEASLNGTRIGRSALDPAWTTYSKRVLYSTYDVTNQLKVGHNCIGVMLGNGWYNPLPLRMWGQLNLRDFLSVGRPGLIAQLDIEYMDGEHALVLSDQSWKTAPGPILQNSIYLGEVYDARREVDGWNLANFDDSNWKQANTVQSPLGFLRPQQQPLVEQVAVLPAVARTQPKPGVFIFDFGQNLAGWVRLRVTGPAGTKVTMRFGELLHPDGTLNTLTTVCGQIKKQGVGGPGAPAIAEQTDIYVLKGSETPGNVEVYTPRFTYHGFRFAEIRGYPGEPPMDAVEAIRLSSAVAPAGEFSCSNELLNRIQSMCRATFPSNLIGVQTDCPGRERFGYGDDIACACEAHLFNYDMAGFYEKTVHDFADAARPNGALTLLAPWTGHAIGGFDPGGGSFADVKRNGENAGTGALSGVLAHPLLVQKLHQFYGNDRLVVEEFDTSRKSLEFVRQHARDHIIEVGLGDWSSVEPTDTAIMDTALYYQHARIVAHLARLLKRNTDAHEYDALAEQIKKAFIDRFLGKATGSAGMKTQAAWACALYHGLCPPVHRNAISQALIDDVSVRHNGHLTTGIFGTKYLLDSLTEIHRPDLAYRVVNQKTYPSWGYMLDRGATTLWEVWDYSDDVYSHNHSMFGTISAWFYTRLGGIRPADDAVAFDKIVLKPQIVPGLTWVRTKYHSPRGAVISSWRIQDDKFIWEVSIPPTSSAVVYFPTTHSDGIREGGKLPGDSKGVQMINDGSGQMVGLIQSGSYVFQSRRLDAKAK